MEPCIDEINKTTREIDFFFSRSKIELWCIELIFQKINSFWYDFLINLDRMEEKSVNVYRAEIHVLYSEKFFNNCFQC